MFSSAFQTLCKIFLLNSCAGWQVSLIFAPYVIISSIFGQNSAVTFLMLAQEETEEKLTHNYQYIMMHLCSCISSLLPNASISPYTCFIPLHVIIKAFGVL